MSANASPPAPKAAQKTTYHVLLQITSLKFTSAPNTAATTTNQPAPTYRLVASDITANSAEHAIRIHAEKHGEEATLIAVPSRSWRPVKVTVATRKTVTLTDA